MTPTVELVWWITLALALLLTVVAASFLLLEAVTAGLYVRDRAVAEEVVLKPGLHRVVLF